jgi:hypothetical protein
LGLVAADARRLVFAVHHEDTPDTSPLARELAELLTAGAALAAARRVAGRPLAELPADARELAARAELLAGHAIELRDRAIAAADPDTAWELLVEATGRAADLPDVARLWRRWPPHPAGTPQVRADAEGPVVSWPASPSRVGEVRYRLMRSDHPFPADGEPGGDLIADTADTSFRDPGAPVNAALHYAVVAERGRVAAGPAVTAAPFRWLPDVADLVTTAGNGLVSVSWRSPPQAGTVVVRRAVGRAPRGPADGTPVPVRPGSGGFVDDGLRSGVTYGYLVVCGYPDADGREGHSAGVPFTVVPTEFPTPVEQFSLAPVEDEPGWLLATFPAPAAGTVELRALADHPPRFGAVLPTADLPGRPVPTVAAPAAASSEPPGSVGLRCRAPDEVAVLLAVTVSGAQAAIGARRLWTPMRPDSPIRVRRHGREVRLAWYWPDGVGETELRWRATGCGWRTDSVSRARYDADGGYTVSIPTGPAVEILIASVVRSGSDRLVGTAGRVVVELPVPATYRLMFVGPYWRRQVVATVTAEHHVRVPTLLLVRTHGREMPLTVDDGVVLASASDVTLGPASPARLAAPVPRRGRPYWLRCFALGGTVDLHDPARDALLVR